MIVIRLRAFLKVIDFFVVVLKMLWGKCQTKEKLMRVCGKFCDQVFIELAFLEPEKKFLSEKLLNIKSELKVYWGKA